jgi:hypothetical protein
MTSVPARVVVPPETSLGEEQSVLLLGILHQVLVVEDDTDPLIEVVHRLTQAGMTTRRIAATLSISRPLVEYLQGMNPPEGREKWYPRQVVQDWATGQSWPMREEGLELVRGNWNDDRDVCDIRLGSVGRQRRFRLPLVAPATAQPSPPSPDDVAHALDAEGARLFGMSEVVGVRARLGRSNDVVAVLAPFTDIVDHRTTELLQEQALRSRPLQEIIDSVLREDGRSAIVERSHEAFVLRVEASSGAERLTREHRQSIAQTGRRVVIAVAEEVGHGVQVASPLSSVVLDAVRAGRWPRDQVTLASHEALRDLDRSADRAAESVSRAIASIVAQQETATAAAQLGYWLLEALLLVQGVIDSGELPVEEQRGRVERLEALLERIVLTHVQEEEERG